MNKELKARIAAHRRRAATAPTREERRQLVADLRAEGLTLEEIGAVLGLSRQRVWQITRGL